MQKLNFWNKKSKTQKMIKSNNFRPGFSDKNAKRVFMQLLFYGIVGPGGMFSSWQA